MSSVTKSSASLAVDSSVSGISPWGTGSEPELEAEPDWRKEVVAAAVGGGGAGGKWFVGEVAAGIETGVSDVLGCFRGGDVN